MFAPMPRSRHFPPRGDGPLELADRVVGDVAPAAVVLAREHRPEDQAGAGVGREVSHQTVLPVRGHLAVVVCECDDLAAGAGHRDIAGGRGADGRGAQVAETDIVGH
jgi:hypothetical protein